MHVRHGAEVIRAAAAGCTTLLDPTGLVYCITD
jgi:hypothetical protein